MVISILCWPSSWQTPLTGKQRLQWRSLGVGRPYLSFQRASRLHPTDSAPLDMEGNSRRTNKVQLKTAAGLKNMHRFWCMWVAVLLAGWAVVYHLDLVHIICQGDSAGEHRVMEVMSRQLFNLHLQEQDEQRLDVSHKSRGGRTEERPWGIKTLTLFYNIHSHRCPPACSTF